MKKLVALTTCGTIFITLMVANTIGARPKTRPPRMRYVRPATAREPQLEAAIISALYAGDAASAKRDQVRYYYNRVELNGDAQPEVLVYIFGPTWCGSAGCAALVFQPNHGQYDLVTQISGVELPVFVSRRRTNGWRDLIAHVRWGEVKWRTRRDYYALLRFDGHTYPDQFPGGAPTNLRLRARCTAYLAGDESPGSGLMLGGGIK